MTRKIARRLRKVALVLAGGLLLLWVGERSIGWCCPLPPNALDSPLASRRVCAGDGSWLRVLPNARGERCLPVPLAAISPHVVRALLAAEDRRFATHTGVDLKAALRAVGQNWSRGRAFSGASTLTMQLARLVDPTPRTLLGKLWQALRARQIEREYPKDTILTAYLNSVPFAGNARGIEAAALLWFGKRAQQLDLVEAATLVGMLPAPGRRSPTARPELVRAARDAVLCAVREGGGIAADELATALARPLEARRHAWPWLAIAASEYFLRSDPALEVQTSLDPGLQQRAEDVVAHLRGLTVSGIAIVMLERETGALVALVGAHDSKAVGLDHALRARPAGSTLKPFLYALALESGVLGATSLLSDHPLEVAGYRPNNFSHTFSGATPMQEALADSKNVPAVRLLQLVGITAFRDFLVRLGLDPGTHRLGLDVALGTLSVRPLDLARAYQKLFATTGPCALASAHRATLLRALSRRSPDASWLAIGEVAFKTGTSSDRRDAWSVGVTDHHVIVVWAGESSGRPEAGLVGARAASEVLAPLVAASR